MQQYKCFLALSAIFVASLATSVAQEAKIPTVHPGDTVKYELRVEGKDADKFLSSIIGFSLITAVKPGQESLNRNFGSPYVSRDKDHPFQISVVIPAYIATGDYVLNASVAISPGVSNFSFSHDEINTPTLHVENDQRIEKPKVVIVPVQ